MLDKDGLAIQDVKLPVYHFDANGEFTALLFIKIEIGTGLPGLSTLVPILEMKDGHTQVFNEEKQEWEHVVDYRYKTAYDINTGQGFEIDYFGELKEEHTLLPPPSYDHEFKGGKWVLSKAKKEEIAKREKDQKVHHLNSEISKLRAKMQEHILMEETEEAKAIVVKIRELEAEIKALE